MIILKKIVIVIIANQNNRKKNYFKMNNNIVVYNKQIIIIMKIIKRLKVAKLGVLVKRKVLIINHNVLIRMNISPFNSLMWKLTIYKIIILIIFQVKLHVISLFHAINMKFVLMNLNLNYFCE